MTDMIAAHEAQALQQQQQQQQQQFQRSSPGDSPARHRARLGPSGGTPGGGDETRGAYLSSNMSGALAVSGRSPGFGQAGGGGGDPQNPQNPSPPTKARLRLINDVYGSDVLAGTGTGPAAVAQQAGWRPSHPEGVPTDAKRAAALEQKVSKHRRGHE